MKNNSISLETLVSGIKGSELIVIGSKPAQGKTFLALTMAKQMVCLNKTPIAFFSLEVSEDVLLSGVSKISGLSTEDIQSLPFYILDNPNMTISELEQHIRDLHREKRIAAVFIDYLGLLQCGKTVPARKEEQAVMFIKLKDIAKELNISIVVTLQIPRDNKEPTPQTIQTLISSEEAFQCIDRLILIQKADTQKSLLTVYKRSQHNEWASEEIPWTVTT